MSPAKIDPDELEELLRKGRSQAQAAKHFGVSEAAVSQRGKKLQIATSKVVALEKAGEVVDRHLSAADRLENVQQLIDEELQWAVAQAKEPDADRRALQDIISRLAGEVRQQLGLQLNITKTLVDLKVVREFQRSVTETIAEVDPSVARQIVARLKERRALRASGTLPALDGQGGF